MNLQMAIRIKARDDFPARFALASVGGRVTEGKHPKFVFASESQRTQYEQLLKRLESENSGVPGPTDSETKEIARRHYTRRTLRRND